MNLEGDFLDLGKQKHNSTFGIASTSFAFVWILAYVLLAFTGLLRDFSRLLFYIVLLTQFLGTILAIISIRKNETRRILYLIGLIINGIGFLYFGLSTIT